MLTGKVLFPVNDRLNFHQTRKASAEAAGVAISDEFGDIRQAVTRLHEQAAGDAQANLRKHFAVSGTQIAEMTLQRARADPQRPRCAIEGRVAPSQRCGNNRANRLE